MYGVPKYKDPFWWKYKKEVYMVAAAFIAVTTITRFSPENQTAETSQTIVENHNITKEVDEAYRIIFNGKEVGIVETEEMAEEVKEKAYYSLKKKLGYDPEIKTDITLQKVREVQVQEGNYDAAAKLEIAYSAMVDDNKQKAYVVKIGNEFTVALPDEESAKEVLLRAQKKFLNTDLVVDIDFAADSHNSLVTKPKLLVFNPDEKERTLVTSGNPTSESKKNPLNAFNNVVTNVKAKMQSPAPAAAMSMPQQMEENAQLTPATVKKESNEKLLEVSLPKNVLIAESYVSPNKIVGIEKALELVTQNRVEQKVYHVEKGDSPSVIAEKNNMGLSKLYQLNPGLKDGTSVIHVGDEIIITAPEPLLKVTAKYETSYQEPILKTVVEEKDPTMYVGVSKIKSEGKDGVQNVTAVITKVNGQQVASEIKDKEVLSPMEPKIRLVGSMPLPPKATTGTFIYPLKRYIFSSGYGYRWGSFHGGIDLAAPRGTTIMAADGGTVTHAGWHSGGYGYMVTIQHTNGHKTLYAHMSKVTCTVGQKVAQGQKIGEVGSTGNSTGNHCHFEIYINGVRVNPTKYL